MDASDFSKGPITRIWTKQPLAHGLHGTYTPHHYVSKPTAGPHPPLQPVFEPEGPMDPLMDAQHMEQNPDLRLSHADASEPEGPLPDCPI